MYTIEWLIFVLFFHINILFSSSSYLFLLCFHLENNFKPFCYSSHSHTLAYTPIQHTHTHTTYDTIVKPCHLHTSTWTIDLCYLLQRFDVRHTYLTTWLGINPTYQTNEYYVNVYGKDIERVTRKFANAKLQGLNVQINRIPNEIILDHLARWGPVLILTNGTLLRCNCCGWENWNCSSEDKRDNANVETT